MLAFIPTPIGNLQDISTRSLEILTDADIIFCEDTRVSKKLLSLLNIPYNEKKFISLHSHNEKDIIANLDISIFDKNIVYMSDAGMPSISDPGCLLVRFAQENDISYEVLPGANAALLAYVASGFCGSEFLFFGFLPHKGKERKAKLQDAIHSNFITIIYESPHRIQKLIDELADHIPDREIFIIKEATKLYEFKKRASSKEIKEAFDSIDKRGEWVVVIDREKKERGVITKEDILSLNIPKKEMAKLLAKLDGRSVKECYNELIKE